MTQNIVNTLSKIMEIDSPTGFFVKADDYLVDEFTKLGFAPVRQNKGGVMVDIGGEGRDICIAAHMDTLGLMVRNINANGTIRVINVGGLRAYYCLNANVRIYSRYGKVYTGTVRKANPSTHLMSDAENTELADYDTNIVVTLDEIVKSASDVEALGIRCGDSVAVEPDFRITPSGFIKSRYLDDKASCAILIEIAKAVKNGQIRLNRHVHLLFTEYEEIGHGGAVIPEGVKDFLSVDIGCIGKDHYSDEQKVSIVTKDSRFPYHTQMLNEMVELADKHNIPYALDMMLPHYGSDGDVTLVAGYDVRHGLIGPGVLETHGYERTHVDALKATYDLVKAIIQ